MALFTAKQKRAPAQPAAAEPSDLDFALTALHNAERAVAEIDAQLAPLLDAQRKAHRGASRHTSNRPALSDVDAEQAAADYYLGTGSVNAVTEQLSAEATAAATAAKDAQVAALAIEGLQKRIEPLQRKRASYVDVATWNRYLALRTLAKQLDDERLALMQADAHLLAQIYALADLIEPLAKAQAHKGAAPIAAPDYLRPKLVEFLPTALRPVGEYAAMIDAERAAAGRAVVDAKLRELGLEA
jgi:hypothetical protein